MKKTLLITMAIMTMTTTGYAKTRTVEDALSDIGTNLIVNTMTGRKTTAQSVTSTVNSTVDTNNKYTDKIAKAAIGVGIAKSVEEVQTQQTQASANVITIDDARVPKKDYQRLIRDAFNRAYKSGTRADLAKLDTLINEADANGLDVSDVMEARQRYFR